MGEKGTENKIVNGVFWKFAERIFAQGVSFVVSVILARLLMPEDYGAVAVMLIFIEIATVFLNSGLNTSLIQKKEVNQLELSTVFYCNMALSIFLYVLLFFTAPLIADIYGIPVLVPATRVFALRLPIAAFQAIQYAIISRQMDFKKSFFCTIGGAIGSAVVGIGMALYGFGVWALVAQYITSTLMDTVVLAIFVRWRPSLKFSFKTAAPLISYGWKVMITDLIGTIFNHLSAMIVGIRYTSADLAYYTKGKQLPQLVKINIFSTLVAVLFPAMSRVSDDSVEFMRMTKKCVRTLCYVMIPMMVGMAAVSRDMVVFLFTEKWIEMTPFVGIVCLESILSLAPTVSSQALKAAGRSDIMLKMEFIKKPLLVISIFAALPFGVLAVAFTLPLNSLLDLVFNAVYTKKIIGYGLIEQVKDYIPSTLMSLVMAAAVIAVGLIEIPLALSLVLQVGVGIAVYLLLSVIFKNPEFASLLDMVKGKIIKKG